MPVGGPAPVLPPQPGNINAAQLGDSARHVSAYRSVSHLL
jgi:hypothetical protein